jgi:hypothetical protein
MIIDSPVISGSAAASFRNVAITGSLGVTGSIITTGTITAQTLVVQTVTSSVIYSSGSNVFGNDIANTQVMTGSVTVTGSLAVITNGTEFQVTSAGVKMGNIIGDTHSITGSVGISGSIGIGVTPGQKFQVRGTNENAIVRVETTGSGNPSISFTTLGQQDWGMGIDYSDSGKLKFDGSTTVGAATKMTLTSAGNLGIGNTTPQATLHLGPSLNTVPASTSIAVAGDTSIRFMAGSDGNANYGSYIAGTQTAGVRALSLGYRQGAGDVLTMTVTQISDGRGGVGIGTSVPTSPLTIKANSRTDTLRLSISGSSSTGETTGITFGSSTYDKAQITAYNENSGNAAGYLAFWTGGSPATTDMTERMRITSTGVISINGNSAESNAGLDKFTIGYYVDNWGWLQTWASRPLYLNKLGNAVYAGSVRLDTLSDERVKDNIQPITGALNKVLSMNGKKFHLLDEPESKIRLGFIAQDLQGVVDELVIESDRTQKLPSGEIVENVLSLETWGSSWAALLVEAIKDLKAEFDAYKATHP